MIEGMSARLKFLTSLRNDSELISVIDVGANPIEGDAPYKPLLDAQLARVTGFEPQADALANLQAKKSELETYYPNALGDGDEVTLRVYRHGGFTSIFKANTANAALIGFHREMQLNSEHAIQTTALDKIDGIERIDFLKIDVQGAELGIITNGQAKLKEAVLVQTEVRFLPLYDGEPTFGQLDAELQRQGFQLYDFAFMKKVSLRSENRKRIRPRFVRQLVDGDAYYVRHLAHIDRYSVDQVFRLAILADGVMNDPSLVLYCLDHLVFRGRIVESAVEGYLQHIDPRMLR